METQKAGCYLVDVKHKKIALIYREKHNDYTFPKGHLENNETLEQCAIRETAEETKRDAHIIDEIPPYIERYTTPTGEKCVCYMFVAIDLGKSNNTSLDTHDLIWVDFDKVYDTLTYQSLKISWNNIKDQINKLFI